MNTTEEKELSWEKFVEMTIGCAMLGIPEPIEKTKSKRNRFKVPALDWQKRAEIDIAVAMLGIE